jgi:hypothetical protein
MSVIIGKSERGRHGDTGFPDARSLFQRLPAASKAVTTPEAGAFFEKLNAVHSTFTGLFPEIEDTRSPDDGC